MKREEISTLRFLILGTGKSGLGAARLLEKLGATFILADERPRPENDEVARAAESVSGTVVWSATPSVVNDADVMVVSPGIPASSPIVTAAETASLRIISEVELAAACFTPRAKVIAITGTNGKTTTTAWIAHVLRTAQWAVAECGNIGNAVSEVALDLQDATGPAAFVVETSSFQLERLEDFRPDVAILTNLSPDHLDRYASYDDYVAAKRNILKNMGPDQAFIWNGDNEASRGFEGNCPVPTWCFTGSGDSGLPGAGVAGNTLVLRDENEIQHDLLEASELAIPGQHNLENALATALAAFLVGASVEHIAEGLRSFRGVEHRIEHCGSLRGVDFYNDSKATNVDSLEKALAAFTRPIVLIAGGRDKHSDYSVIRDLVQRKVATLVTIGEAAPLIEAAWGQCVPQVIASASMADAVQKASSAAQEIAGRHSQVLPVVLLSPACASYDMYNNFEERGRDFKSCVAAVTKS